MKVLSMNVKSVRHQTSHSFSGIFIYNQEIPHIQEQTKIGMIHTIDELLHPIAVLTEESVVFHHGLDAKLSTELCNRSASLDQDGQGIIKAPSPCFGFGPTPGGIMAHSRSTQDLGHPHFVFNAFNFYL